MVRLYFDWTVKNGVEQIPETFKNQGIIVTTEDDGFLPEGVISPYRYYVDKECKMQKKEKLLFTDLLDVPPFWEIRMFYTKAEIWDEGVKKAEIEYAFPHEQHNVKTVKWLQPDGKVCKIDHYDKYGQLYYFELCGVNEMVNVQVYMAGNKPVLIVQPQMGTYTVMHEGQMQGFYNSKEDFIHHFVETAFEQTVGLEKKLFSKEILILTNSDQLEQIENLINDLENFHFHIAAKTNMSDKLRRLKQYKNVSLYEGISEVTRNELLDKCSFYLDVNHYSEICDAAYEAKRHNLLVLGFDITIHNKKYVLPECIFTINEMQQMVTVLRETAMKPSIFSEWITKQSLL